jgi:hypothetical protein
MLSPAQYNKRLEETEGKSAVELTTMNVGKLDPKKHLESSVEELMTRNISQCLGSMLDTVVRPPPYYSTSPPPFSLPSCPPSCSTALSSHRSLCPFVAAYLSCLVSV